IEWLSLGHANNVEIEKKLRDMNYNFDSMWNKAKHNADGSCPAGYKSTNSGNVGQLCVQLKKDQAIYASRFETRLYAAYLGATTEFNKSEGITFNPDQNRLYLAISNIEKSMEDNRKKSRANDKYDKGGNNDIKLAYNVCGAVYSLDVVENKKDFSGKPIQSNFVATNMYAEVAGQVVNYSNPLYASNQCNLNSISSPDNLSYLPKYGVLLIGEDTQDNQTDKIWAYNVRSKKLTKIFSAPYGSESTSPYWYTNINGFGYFTAVVQHPYGETDKDKARNEKDKESYVGYVGPFPRLD
ncbi:MAG: phosphatase, partial [Gammaproteobacteria bacterium]|nr:phosphatase [Gammaproteobacteria bacterium]